MSDTFVDPLGGYNVSQRLSEQLVWWIAKPLRWSPHPQVGPLARFLLHLSIDDLRREGLNDHLLNSAVEAVRDLPHGEEVAESFVVLAQMVQVERLPQIEAVARACEDREWLAQRSDSLLRPRVVESLRGLLDVAMEIHRFQSASSPAIEGVALNRATGMLEELADYI